MNGQAGDNKVHFYTAQPGGSVSRLQSHCGELLPLIPMLGAIGAGVICQAQFPVKPPSLTTILSD